MAELETSRLLPKTFIAAFAHSESATPSDSSSATQSPQSPAGVESCKRDISLDLLAVESQARGPTPCDPQPPPSDLTHPPVKLDTSFTASHQASEHSRSRSFRSEPDTASIAGSVFHFLSYTDVDKGQKEEFKFLIDRETGWRRLCFHKGLVANLLFLLLMVAGIVLGEVLFPLEGLRGNGGAISNDTMCLTNLEGCVSVRILRAVGLFGFIGGITNWVAIEMLFIRIPFLVGTGVIAQQYKEIRESIRRIVVNTLFDPSAVSEYFSGQRKHTIEMLHLGHHFGGLLDSAAANAVVVQKIDAALAGPEGFVLTLLGVDHNELKSIIRNNVQLFLADISPIILDKISPGLIDGEGLQEEVERILEEKIEELSAAKVQQIITLIIRKHLSWLIVWGNISGAVIGLLSEIASVLVAYSYGEI